MRVWKPEERQAIDKFLTENSLESSGEDVETWIEALMGEGLPFELALDRAELMFAE
jgi:hypothetical protein